MSYKSPFFIVKEFISPLQCEDIVERLNNNYPNTDVDDVPVKNIKYNNLTELRILPALEDILPKLENYYSFKTKGILPFKFEWYVEDFKVEPPQTLSYVYRKHKWTRVSEISFTGIIFLTDYNDKPPFDNDFEVYGGKLEFMTHRFGFNPQRGTLVCFPEGPNFINTTAQINAGELNQIRFHIVAETPYNYDPNNFPGNYKVWF